ncbi:MAG: hypothetical protein R3300_22275, partial [Candidatus Promineifilaceae bacterium]|nr:hypothetical protein [Candidatus Promineifilaceae bacterium]
FLEDFSEDPPRIERVQAMARSHPWDISGILLDMIFLGAGAVDEWMDAARLGGASDEMVQELNAILADLTRNICARTPNCEGVESVELSPLDYGPIGEFRERHIVTEFRPAPETAFQIADDDPFQIQLIDTGTSRLAVRPNPDEFGLETIEETTDMTVREIEVTTIPTTVKVEPKQQVCFQGQVENAHDKGLDWYVTGPDHPRTLEGHSDGSGPGDDFCFTAPDWEITIEDVCAPPEGETREYSIEAVSTAEGGLRADGDPIRQDTSITSVVKEPREPPQFPPDCTEDLEACEWRAYIVGANGGLYEGHNAMFMSEGDDISPGSLEIALFQRNDRPTGTDAYFNLGHTPITPGIPTAAIGFTPTGDTDHGYGGEGSLTILHESDEAVIGTFFGQMWLDGQAMIFDEPPDSLVRGMFHACPSDGMPQGAPPPINP